MAIITISRGSYSMGKAVAERVAEELGYRIISRDLLLKASDRFHVPQQTLLRAIHDAPGIFERYQHTKEIYMAYIRSALVDMVADDNVVYHGLAGHLLLKGLDHVLKARIIADLKGRVKRKMEEEALNEISAGSTIREDDEQRRKWTRKVYGVDPKDSSLYDMVLCIDRLRVDNAADLICSAVRTGVFDAGEAGLRKAKDLSLACRVKAALVEDFPEAGVSSDYGNVLIYMSEKDAHSSKLKKLTAVIGQEHKEIHNLEIHSGLPVPSDAV